MKGGHAIESSITTCRSVHQATSRVADLHGSLRVVGTSGLWVASASMLLPFFWMVSTALKPDGAVMVLPIQWWPSSPAWENFRRLSESFPVGRFVLNSVIVATSGTVGQILIAAMGAYAFARLHFQGKDALFVLYLATLMIPAQVTLIPLFVVMRFVGWVDTYQALILPQWISPFAVFLLRQHFQTIPRQLDEAAFIDGAGHWTVFTRVLLPLARPALGAVFIFAFMGSWNDFLWPLIVINDTNRMTLPLGLATLHGRWTSQWNLVMAGAVVAVLPIFLVFLAAQRQFIRGLTLSALKG